MHILIVDRDTQDRALAAECLQSAGHDIATACAAKDAMALIERRAPDVVVLDALLGGMSPVRFLQHLRGEEYSNRSYVVVASSRPSTIELASTISAGADDYVCKPIQPADLVTRVGAIERVQRWADTLFGDGASSFDLLSTDLTGLPPWRTVERARAYDSRRAAGASATGAVLSSELALTFPSDQMDMRLTVSVDLASCPRLNELCLGDSNASTTLSRDVLREFANTAGGAFARAALYEGVSLRVGTPVDLAVTAVSAELPCARRQFVLSPADGSIHVTFELEILATALRRVHVDQIVEGMVLARNLHTEQGTLLVPGGTRLTSLEIERVGLRVSPRLVVDVARTAWARSATA